MITKRSLFSWTLRRHGLLQFLLLFIILASIFFRLIPLEFQKRIVNLAIPQKSMDLLLLYCGLYIGAVILFGLLKFAINMLQSYMEQKILAEMRLELYEHILKLPLQFFRRTQPGTVMTSLGSEISAVASFLGGAFTTPVTNVLTLATFGGYMIYLDTELAFISLAIYPVEILIIPILQRQYNRLNVARVNETRAMSNAIGEAVSGIHEIQGNASYRLELERLGNSVNKLFLLVNRMNLFHHSTKCVNNFFQSLGPFALFLVGGYHTMQGHFTLGALVAFLSAFEKIYDPWKELINYYKQYQDARVRYKRIMETFDVAPDFEVLPAVRPVYRVDGELEVKDLTYRVENDVHLLDGISFHLNPGEHMALVGFSGSGKSTLAMVLGQQYRYDQGQVLLGGHELRRLTKMDISHNIGFVSQHPFIFNGTVRENILYGRLALLLAEGEKENLSLPAKEEVMAMLKTVGLEQDIARFGLETVIHLKRCEPLVPAFLQMRQLIRKRLGEKLAEVVESYDVNKFLRYASIYDNILFSDAYAPSYRPENLPANPIFLKFLADMNLDERLLRLGKELAQQTVILFNNLGENDAFFFEATPMKPAYFETYNRIVTRPGALSRSDKALLLKLALDFVPARHKIATISPSLQELIVQARHRFIQDVIGLELAVFRLPVEDCGTAPRIPMERTNFSPYCPTEYQYSHTLFDNLVYGRIKAEQASARTELMEQITQMLTEEHLLEEIIEAGLDFEVGSKGDRLSGGQRQKVALARALLKEPPVLILDEATASLDNASQNHIQQYIDTRLRGKGSVVAVIHRLDMASHYDKILVLRGGRVVESGHYEELVRRKGIFYELVNGNGNGK